MKAKKRKGKARKGKGKWKGKKVTGAAPSPRGDTLSVRGSLNSIGEALSTMKCVQRSLGSLEIAGDEVATLLMAEERLSSALTQLDEFVTRRLHV